MKPSTLLIGLDGATFSILNPLMEEGVMPFLKQLLDRGVSTELASVVPPLTPPAWTSLMTGRSPGNHGIFDFLRFEFGDKGKFLHITDANDLACETLWSIVSRQNLQATVLNFPLTFPPPKIRGHVVPGWVPWRHLRLACHPTDLYEKLKTLPDFNPRELAMDMSMEEEALEGCHTESDYEHNIKVHIRRELQWFNIARYLMRTEPSELTAVLFDGVDKLQHFCWRFIDPDQFPANPTDAELRIRKLCLDYYREVDRMVAELVTDSGEGVNTIIVSDHGFGPTQRVFYLNAWLEQKGYLVWNKPADIEEKHPETLGLGTMAKRFYDINWDKTRAYCPTPSSNGIYLFADDPKDYQALVSELKRELPLVCDPTTGKPIVQDLWTKEEAFSGKKMEQAPDLTLYLDDGGFVSILPSEDIVTTRSEVVGTHRPNGVFAASGPMIQAQKTQQSLSIVDVAPLILYSLGLPIPKDLEGRFPEEMIAPDYLQQHPVSYGEATQMTAATSSTASQQADVEDEVLKQLQALGYME